MAQRFGPQDPRQRKGMSTLAKVLLIGGGVFVTFAIVLVVFVIWAAGKISDSPEFAEIMEEIGEQVEAEIEIAAVTAAGSIRTDINAAVVAVLDAMVAREEGISVQPGEEGSGVAFQIDVPGRSLLGVDFASVAEVLDRVESGEMRFRDLATDTEADAGADAGASERHDLPEWVGRYPGSRRDANFRFDLDEFVLGGAVFVADATTAEVLDWYSENGVDSPSARFSTNRSSGDDWEKRRDGHISLTSGDRRLSVLSVEDDHGDSLFVLLWKE